MLESMVELWLVGFISVPFFVAGITALALPLPNVVRFVELASITVLQFLVLGSVISAELH